MSHVIKGRLSSVRVDDPEHEAVVYIRVPMSLALALELSDLLVTDDENVTVTFPEVR